MFTDGHGFYTNIDPAGAEYTMNDVEINPYYESLITGNDHQQHFQAQQKHSTIMTHISETSEKQ